MNPENKSLAEITVKAVVLGVVLAMVLAAANAYLGLFAGMTVSASIPAAVVSMGILRMFKNSNILENNIVQTAASAGESLAAGVIFTLPGLIILGFWQEFNFFWVSVIAGFGGVLGVLFTIPLRRSLIVEGDLKFPEGVATAEVLETGQKGGAGGIKYIVRAAIAGSLFKIGAEGIGLWPAIVEGAVKVKGSIAYFGSNLSPALLSVGYIVGLNIAALIFIGGACNWFGAIPIVAAQHEWPVYQLKSEVAEENLEDWNLFALEYEAAGEEATQVEIDKIEENNAEVTAKIGQQVDAKDYSKTIWDEFTRYLGVGGMLIGGLWTVFQMRGSLLSGITSGLKAYKNSGPGTAEIPRTEKDMPMKWILILIMASVVPLYLVYQYFVGVKIAIPMAIIMLIAGFVFSAVAGYMAGLVGSSNNPISGVTIATIVVSSLLLVLLMGKGAPSGPAAAIIIGSVVCCAAAIAGDNMQDLKAGHIVGATPWRQQVMQLVGTASAAIVIAPVLMLLQKAYGFAGTPGAGENALAAPQANLMASVAKGVFEEGGLPWGFVFAGMGIAVGVIILDLYLGKINSNFRTPVLAVAIGFYLPFELSVPIIVGGLINHFVKQYQKSKNMDKDQVANSNRNGLLFASGLITGEALTGILMAIPIVMLANSKSEVTLPLLGMGGESSGKLLGIIVLVVVAVWLLKTAMISKNDKQS